MKVSISAKTVLLKIVMIFIIPFFLFLIICFGYGYVDSYYNRSMSNRSELKMYQSFLEDEMQKISFFMSDIAANNTAFSCFRYPQSSLDEHLNKYSLMEKFESIMKIDERINLMGIISTEYNVYGTNYRRGISYDKKEHIDNYIRERAALNEDDEIGRWEICKIDGTNYFLQIMGSRGVYCFCLVSLASASQKMDTGHGWRYITFADENGFLLYEKEMEALRLRWKTQESYLGGRFFQQLVTGSSSDIMGCNMVLIDSMWSVWTAKSVPFIVACFAILFFLILMKCYRMVKTRFLLPLGAMVETMDRIASGKLESTLVVGSDIEDNMVLHFHRYAENPDIACLKPYMEKAEELDIPLWLGETGENTNEWYAALYPLSESLGIGYNIWPWKKMSCTNSPYSIQKPEGYEKILGYINGGPHPGYLGAQKIFDEYLENIKIENCKENLSVTCHVLRRAPFCLRATDFDECPGQGISFSGTAEEENSIDYRRGCGMKLLELNAKEEKRFGFDCQWDRYGLVMEEGEFACYRLEAGKDIALNLNLEGQKDSSVLEISGMESGMCRIIRVEPGESEVSAAVPKGETGIRIMVREGKVCIVRLEFQ